MQTQVCPGMDKILNKTWCRPTLIRAVSQTHLCLGPLAVPHPQSPHYAIGFMIYIENITMQSENMQRRHIFSVHKTT